MLKEFEKTILEKLLYDIRYYQEITPDYYTRMNSLRYDYLLNEADKLIIKIIV